MKQSVVGSGNLLRELLHEDEVKIRVQVEIFQSCQRGLVNRSHDLVEAVEKTRCEILGDARCREGQVCPQITTRTRYVE